MWRHATDFPIPEPEGDRALLVWQDGEITTGKPTHFGTSWKSIGYTTLGGQEVPVGLSVPAPGDRPEGLHWTWADGDPWTRASAQARKDEKLLHYSKQYGMTDEQMEYVKALRPHRDFLVEVGEELAAQGRPPEGWSPSIERRIAYAGCPPESYEGEGIEPRPIGVPRFLGDMDQIEMADVNAEKKESEKK